MKELRTRLARLLIEKSYLEGDFTLTSGRKTDYYFDCKQTALNAEGGYLIGRLFLDLIPGASPAVAVAGMTLGADPLVSAVSVLAHQAGRPLHALIIRKEPKGHGTGQYLEGLKNVAAGDSVVVLEDVVTTAGTLVKACQRVVAAGLKISQVICVLDREEGGREILAAQGYTLESIFTRKQLLEAAKG